MSGPEVGALLTLPEVGALQLSDEELKGLAGSTQSRLQVEWLEANGWVFFLTRGGRPIVGRLYANLKLAGVDLRDIHTKFQLNMDAIR